MFVHDQYFGAFDQRARRRFRQHEKQTFLRGRIDRRSISGLFADSSRELRMT